jgi:hypothetical protein
MKRPAFLAALGPLGPPVFASAVLAAAVAGAQAPLKAPLPVGPDFLVNQQAISDQELPAVDADPAGRFVVSWGFSYDGSFGYTYSRLMTRRFDGAGQPLTGELQVATKVDQYNDPFVAAPHLAVAPDGGFVIAYQDGWTYYGLSRVRAKRFDKADVQQGFFQVSDTTPYRYLNERPAVELAADGGFFVAWDSAAPPDDEVRVRRYSSMDVPLGEPAAGSSVPGGAKCCASVARRTDDGFLVVWQGEAGGSGEVMARRFGADGVPAGGDFPVNAGTAGSQTVPQVAALPDGRFAVVWSGDDADGRGIFGRFLAPDGTPVGGDLPLNAHTAGTQDHPVVAHYADGFVAIWEGDGADDGGSGIFGRVVDGGGTPGGAFHVNAVTAGDQARPAVTALTATSFVVVWESDGADAEGRGIVGRVFEGLFSDDFESGDTAAWSATAP